MSWAEIPESEALREQLRAAVGEDHMAAHALVETALTRYLLDAWHGTFVGEDLVGEVVAGCGYESWLWVMGDRRWAQLADTLAGRLYRRAGQPGAAVASCQRSVTAGS